MVSSILIKYYKFIHKYKISRNHSYTIIIIIMKECHAARTDSPNSLSPSVSIIHRFRQVFNTTSCVRTELA